MYRCDQRFVLDPLREMMEVKDVYGLIVMDRREATIGLLKGTKISVSAHLTSGVPGKFRAGGQCCMPDTLIQSSSGEILEIKNSHNPYDLKSVDFESSEIDDSPITDKWSVKKNEIYKLKTKIPANNYLNVLKII